MYNLKKKNQNDNNKTFRWKILKLSSIKTSSLKSDLWLKAIYSLKYFYKKSRGNEDHKVSVQAKNLEEG